MRGTFITGRPVQHLRAPQAAALAARGRPARAAAAEPPAFKERPAPAPRLSSRAHPFERPWPSAAPAAATARVSVPGHWPRWRTFSDLSRGGDNSPGRPRHAARALSGRACGGPRAASSATIGSAAPRRAGGLSVSNSEALPVAAPAPRPGRHAECRPRSARASLACGRAAPARRHSRGRPGPLAPSRPNAAGRRQPRSRTVVHPQPGNTVPAPPACCPQCGPLPTTCRAARCLPSPAYTCPTNRPPFRRGPGRFVALRPPPGRRTAASGRRRGRLRPARPGAAPPWQRCGTLRSLHCTTAGAIHATSSKPNNGAAAGRPAPGAQAALLGGGARALPRSLSAPHHRRFVSLPRPAPRALALWDTQR